MLAKIVLLSYWIGLVMYFPIASDSGMSPSEVEKYQNLGAQFPEIFLFETSAECFTDRS